MASLKKPLLITAVVGLAAFGAYKFWPASEQASAPQRKAMNPWTMPVPVRVVPAAAADLRVQVKAIGTVTPLNTVLVQSRVSGPLQQLLFKEGDKVKQGELLAQIDPATYQIQLAQAQGQLEQNLAQLTNAQQDLALYTKLREQSSISAQQFNQQQALVAQLEGTIKANRAQIDAARLQLSYTRIEAPISGRLGLRRVDAGNLIQANAAEGLVTITQSAPINVLFSIPETQLSAVRAAVNRGETLSVEAWDRAEQHLLSTGELTTLDNQIDIATGTLKLKAEFANSGEELFPNQFVNVRLNIARQQGVIAIPQDAVQYGSAGTYVYVIEQNKAQIRQIQLGEADNGQIAVLSGLKAGDLVVLEGLDRLRPGRAVEVITDTADSSEPPAAEQEKPARRQKRSE